MFKQQEYKNLIVCSNKISRGQSLFPMFKEIKDFIQKHPKEFIIVKLKSEGENVEGFCNNIVAEQIIDEFRAWMVTQADVDDWFDVETMTMSDLACRDKQIIFLVNDAFFDKYLNKMEKDYIENSEIAREYLMKRGIFPLAKFARNEKFKTDDIQDLLIEMDKSFEHVVRKLLRVNHYTLTALKKLQVKYIWKPPTIHGMEKNEFFRNNKAIGHIVESINKGKDINIGNGLTSGFGASADTLFKLVFPLCNFNRKFYSIAWI